jgi:hypothetical protein
MVVEAVVVVSSSSDSEKKIQRVVSNLITFRYFKIKPTKF